MSCSHIAKTIYIKCYTPGRLSPHTVILPAQPQVTTIPLFSPSLLGSEPRLQGPYLYFPEVDPECRRRCWHKASGLRFRNATFYRIYVLHQLCTCRFLFGFCKVVVLTNGYALNMPARQLENLVTMENPFKLV